MEVREGESDKLSSLVIYPLFIPCFLAWDTVVMLSGQQPSYEHEDYRLTLRITQWRGKQLLN